MNFLAHAWLAGPLAADRVGGMIGDFVKGGLAPPPPGLTAELAEGVRLHRLIDSFADRHSAFQRSRARVSSARRRVGGIMVDMFYDHFLARHWDRFSAEPLAGFTAALYRELHAGAQALPPSFLPVFERMAADDWLAGYREAERVADALDRMAVHRLRRPNPLAGAGEELERDYAGFEADFLVFLPDAERFAAAARAARGDAGQG